MTKVTAMSLLAYKGAAEHELLFNSLTSKVAESSFLFNFFLSDIPDIPENIKGLQVSTSKNFGLFVSHAPDK